MNETDVRETIVRPFIENLGYRQGTEANIRTEVPLRYDRAFLGHKKPQKDPPLAGRADYICDAISYGRWVIEVKSPSRSLTREDAEQAHTYCAHPEICAMYFVLTNGKVFQLYATGQLDKPLMEWPFEDTDRHRMTLKNILGYEAIRTQSASSQVEIDEPLGLGLSSKMKIIGGEVHYGEQYSDHPLFQNDVMNGATMSVYDGFVHRASDRRVHAHVRVRSPYPQFSNLVQSAGLDRLDFYTAEKYVSFDREHPTIFQNFSGATLNQGLRVSPFPGLGEIVFPANFQFTATTQAIGYVERSVFKGSLSIDYSFTIVQTGTSGDSRIDAVLSSVPNRAKLSGTGTFQIILTRADHIEHA